MRDQVWWVVPCHIARASLNVRTDKQQTHIFLVAEQHVSSKKRYDFPEQWKPDMVMWITG
jgi:hypothetical protein